MYVVRHMSSPPVTVKPQSPICSVQELLESHHFRHMPVVDDDNRLVGIVTDRDLRSAYPSTVLGQMDRTTALNELAKTPVSEIMTRGPITVTAGATLDDALFLLDHHKVGALPVVDPNGALLGMFSIRDLMRAYKDLFGLGERGSALIEVTDDGKPHLLKRIVQALEEKGVQFTRLVRTRSDDADSEKAVVYVRVHTYNIHAVHEVLRAAGLHVG